MAPHIGNWFEQGEIARLQVVVQLLNALVQLRGHGVGWQHRAGVEQSAPACAPLLFERQSEFFGAWGARQRFRVVEKRHVRSEHARVMPGCEREQVVGTSHRRAVGKDRGVGQGVDHLALIARQHLGGDQIRVRDHLPARARHVHTRVQTTREHLSHVGGTLERASICGAQFTEHLVAEQLLRLVVVVVCRAARCERSTTDRRGGNRG